MMTNLKNLNIAYENEVAIVQFNQENSKVNTLSQAMMNEFIPALNHLQSNDNIKAVVFISTKIGSFIAGADINMIEAIKTREEFYEKSRQGQDIMHQIEKSSKPIVAAVAGSCLGGGFEVVLACHYRIALNDKRTGFGLPEVKLGILPGIGGTQRILKNLELPDALDLLLTGKEIQAKKAKAMGLIDYLVQSIGSNEENIEYLRTIAIKKAKELITNKQFKQQNGFIRNIRSKIILNAFVRNYILSQAQKKVLSQTYGLYPAPIRILHVIKETLDNDSNVGFIAEAEAFADLAMTNESKALIRLFHGRTECKKNRYINWNRNQENENDSKNLFIIGSNNIGAGIAHISIDKMVHVILYDKISRLLSCGQSQIINGYKIKLERDRITNTEYHRILSHLTCQTTYENIGKSDFIIENSFEDIEIKRKYLNEVENYMSNKCIYIISTFILPIHKITGDSQCLERIVGIHYSSPVEKVELVEIIRTKYTSDNTISSTVNLAIKQGKLVIVVNDQPGFYITRLLIFTCVEVFYLLKEGISAKEIDQATRKLGFHVGLATLIDSFGIDMIAFCILQLETIYGERLIDKCLIELIHELIKNNFLGKKTQQGLYVYDNKHRKHTNFKCQEILDKMRTQTSETSTIEVIQWRVTLRFLNEAVKCLEENVIFSPADGDIGAVFGLGFPPMKGGPFHFIDTYGIGKIVDLMNEYHSKYGIRFSPTKLLINMRNENENFYSSLSQTKINI